MRSSLYYHDDIKFATIVRVEHFRVRQAEELILFLSMTFSTREEMATEMKQMEAAGVPLIPILKKTRVYFRPP